MVAFLMFVVGGSVGVLIGLFIASSARLSELDGLRLENDLLRRGQDEKEKR